MTMKKQHFKLIAELRCCGLLLVATLFAFSSVAQADGGFVVLRRDMGPFVVTVFTSPGSLRAGPVDISVLVQDRASRQPVLDAEVVVSLKREGANTIVEQATREAAQNKLFYSALIDLPEVGQWDLEVTIKQGKDTTSIVGEVSAAAPAPLLLSYWRALSLPPIVIAMFTLNQWLKRRSAERENALLRHS